MKLRFKRMKSITRSFFATLLLLCMIIANGIVSYADGADAHFGSTEYSVNNGQRFSVGFYLDTPDGAGMGKFHVEVEYDANRMKYVSGADKAEGNVLIFEGDAWYGSGMKYWLVFEAISGGEAYLEVKSSEIHALDETDAKVYSVTASSPVHIAGTDTAIEIEKKEQEKKEKEEQERLEQEQKEKERKEKERLAQEEAERQEMERLSEEEAKRQEEEQAKTAETTETTETASLEKSDEDTFKQYAKYVVIAIAVLFVIMVVLIVAAIKKKKANSIEEDFAEETATEKYTVEKVAYEKATAEETAEEKVSGETKEEGGIDLINFDDYTK